MAVRAIKDYEFDARDAEENFGGSLVIYVGWAGHVMFATPYAWPLPPDLSFMNFVNGPLAQAFGHHPDWGNIDWQRVVWTKNGEPVTIDLEKSISESGLIHKDALVFTTPGQNGLNDSGI